MTPVPHADFFGSSIPYRQLWSLPSTDYPHTKFRSIVKDYTIESDSLLISDSRNLPHHSVY